MILPPCITIYCAVRLFLRGHFIIQYMRFSLIVAGIILSAVAAQAQDVQFSPQGRATSQPVEIAPVRTSRFSLHAQATYIYQYKPKFKAPYSGLNSLLPAEETQNSVTATFFAGARLWKGAEVYVNPEIAGGSGLSGALGMAGSSNGETFRVGNPAPTLYLARAYFVQSFSLGVNREFVPDEKNQVANLLSKDYVKLFVGKLSMADLFDENQYANSPRTQFMNWGLMNNGAWDYAANTRGYTYTLAAELNKGKMNYKAALAALPSSANGPDLTAGFGTYSINAQVARSWELGMKGRKGAARLLGYYNRTTMGNYREAIRFGAAFNDTPRIYIVQGLSTGKYGFTFNAEQELTDNLDAFARIGWNDGQTETWCFTEIDRTISLGLHLDGNAWSREEDHAGIALLANGLSDAHRDYLAAGGSGFILGDGALNYTPEGILELYYSFKPLPVKIWFTGDYQFCINPGYNADRGPAHIFSIRAHMEL